MRRRRWIGDWVRVELDVRSINRPHFFYWNWEGPSDCMVDAIDRRGGIAVSWGNGNSDPVWVLEIQFPEWLLRHLPERS